MITAFQMNILTVKNKKEDKILRQPTSEFDFSKFSKPEIKKIIQTMRQKMKETNGVGLSANQIGLNAKIFVAEFNNKFYAIFNPEITKTSKEILELEEGCLSVPEAFGKVKRAEKIVISGFNADEKKIKIKAWGMLARIFQHEIDHLNGVLFIDKTRELRKISNYPKI